MFKPSDFVTLLRRIGPRRLLLGGVCFLVAGGLAILLSRMLFEKGVAPHWKIFFVIAGVAVLAAALHVQGLTPWARKAAVEPRQRSFSAELLVILMNLVGFLSATLGLISPAGVVEPRPGDIAAQTRLAAENSELIRKELVADKDDRLLAAMAGTWGEDDCGVTYLLELGDESLTFRSVKNEPSMTPYHFVGTIVGITPRLRQRTRGVSIYTETASPVDRRGDPIEFTYETNGVTDSLVRDDRRGALSLKLARCPAGSSAAG